jgi:hypothetical protein
MDLAASLSFSCITSKLSPITQLSHDISNSPALPPQILQTGRKAATVHKETSGLSGYSSVDLLTVQTCVVNRQAGDPVSAPCQLLSSLHLNWHLS